ncbi:MAG: lipoyl(octanoyl) transferase LipB [Planctomycetota bacterium]
MAPDSSGSPVIPVVDLGRADYRRTLEAMRTLRDRVRRGESPGEVWLVEHERVWTAGRATPPGEITHEHVPIERGGKLTWHGPGQLVVYPVVRLPRRDVLDWLRRLELFGCAICGSFGLEAVRSTDGTGVFVDGRKVASIGVAIAGWVSMHGIAINVAIDTTDFFAIRPCGLDPTVMVDLSTLLGRAISMDEARDAARSAIPSLLAR